MPSNAWNTSGSNFGAGGAFGAYGPYVEGISGIGPKPANWGTGLPDKPVTTTSPPSFGTYTPTPGSVGTSGNNYGPYGAFGAPGPIIPGLSGPPTATTPPATVPTADTKPAALQFQQGPMPDNSPSADTIYNPTAPNFGGYNAADNNYQYLKPRDRVANSMVNQQFGSTFAPGGMFKL